MTYDLRRLRRKRFIERMPRTQRYELDQRGTPTRPSCRLRKYLAEITLLGQPFVKDPELTVEKLLKKSGATVTGFVRYEVGQGIEKKHDDFVGEVMAQVKANR